MKSIDNRRTPEQHEVETDMESWVYQVNGVFRDKNSTYHASVIESGKGEQEVFIEGEIGVDKIYATTSVVGVGVVGDKNTFNFVPDRVGLITKDGKVFSVDGLMHEEGITTNIVFITSVEKNQDDYFRLTIGKNFDRLKSGLPETTEDVGRFLHELGHEIRARKRRADLGQMMSFHEAHIQFEKSGEGNNMSLEQDRKIMMDEERGAWAVGISLLREVGKSIDLDASSTENVGLIIRDSESALRTYDCYSYNITSQSEESRLPSFSREMRNASKQLHKQMKEKGIRYQDLSNFDDISGMPIGNNPKKQIERIRDSG